MENRLLAVSTRPSDLNVLEITASVTDSPGILITNTRAGDTRVGVEISYDEGLALREWLNRIYGNG